MKEMLELRVLQAGFGGVTGTLYRIEPNGTFVVKTLHDDVEGELVKSGELDLAAMMAISQKLDAAQLEDLPERSVMYTDINPARIKLRYGKLARVIRLPPGQVKASDCEKISGSGEVCGILELSDSIVKSAKEFGD